MRSVCNGGGEKLAEEEGDDMGDKFESALIGIEPAVEERNERIPPTLLSL